jgi:molybdopterin molybdotransferase
MLSLEEAQARVLATITPLGNEVVALISADGRIAAEDLYAAIDLPCFDNSAMDGFAVRAADVINAGAEAPVKLRLTGTVAAGERAVGAVAAQSAVRVFTGSPLPAGADAVVMQEDTRCVGDMVEVLDAVKPCENVRLRGEDLKCGALLCRRGEALGAGIIAALAGTGAANARVGKKPRIALLSTGDELREPGTGIAPGQIYESNRVTLTQLIHSAGGVAVPFPIVPDAPEATRDALERAFAEADAVVTTGGVSVGERDFVKAAFEEIGGVQEFWRVAIRPGKPFVFGRRGQQAIFGLPGNPVSAFVTFLLLVRPALLKWQGANDVNLEKQPGLLAESVVNTGERRHFMRVTLGPGGTVRSAGTQASHMLSSLARANGLLDLPPGAQFAAGARVEILRW